MCLELESGTPGDKGGELRFEEQGRVPPTYRAIREKAGRGIEFSSIKGGPGQVSGVLQVLAFLDP